MFFTCLWPIYILFLIVFSVFSSTFLFIAVNFGIDSLVIFSYFMEKSQNSRNQGVFLPFFLSLTVPDLGGRNLGVRIRALYPDPEQYKTLIFCWHNLFNTRCFFFSVISSYIQFSSSYSTQFCTEPVYVWAGGLGRCSLSTHFPPLFYPPPRPPLVMTPVWGGGGERRIAHV